MDPATTAARLRAALETVIDPELGIDIVALGLVYHASVEDGVARIVHTLTSPACPLGPLIDREIRDAVAAVEGIEAVETRLVWEPAWTPSRMRPEARARLGLDEGSPGIPGEPAFPMFPGGDDWLWEAGRPGAGA